MGSETKLSNMNCRELEVWAHYLRTNEDTDPRDAEPYEEALAKRKRHCRECHVDLPDLERLEALSG